MIGPGLGGATSTRCGPAGLGVALANLDVMEREGIAVVETAVGDRYVLEEMRAQQAAAPAN